MILSTGIWSCGCRIPAGCPSFFKISIRICRLRINYVSGPAGFPTDNLAGTGTKPASVSSFMRNSVTRLRKTWRAIPIERWNLIGCPISTLILEVYKHIYKSLGTLEELLNPHLSCQYRCMHWNRLLTSSVGKAHQGIGRDNGCNSRNSLSYLFPSGLGPRNRPRMRQTVDNHGGKSSTRSISDNYRCD